MPLPAAEYGTLMEGLIPVALEAGRAILRHYAGEFDVSYKADRSPVTEADQEAEDIIIRALGVLMPGVPIIAEEQAARGILPEIGRRFFLVDPLDGTKEFIRRNGEFTVNIAFVEDGKPVFGLVYAPALYALYVTEAPNRAVFATISPGGDLSAAEFSAVHSRQPEQDGLIAFTSRSHQTEATRNFLSRHRISQTRTAGSSLKFCLVAQGEADVYPRFGPTSEWDTAAGHAVLRAAGGCVLTVDGAPLRYGKAETRFINPGFIAWGRVPVVA